MMKADDALVFIDANQYLDLYRLPHAKDLLETLQDLHDYIFVTVQIVDEVQRNKLQVAAQSLTELLKKLNDVPAVPGLSNGLNNINQRIKSVKADLGKDAIQTLQQISMSKDEVSKTLDALFRKAVKPTPEELQRARGRKEIGNPPGKKSDPLGDQLTWEQLLSHCQGKSKIWIISKDKDYCISYGKEVFMNSFLYQELSQMNQSGSEVFCFNNPAKGIGRFSKTPGVKAKKQLLPPKVLQEIEREQDSLPPRPMTLDWMSVSNFVPNVDTRIGNRAFVLFGSGESYTPKPPGPDNP